MKTPPPQHTEAPADPPTPVRQRPGDGRDGKTTDARFSPEPPARLGWAERRPMVFKALVGLDRAARDGLEPDLVELVRLRASQLNQCALSLDLSTKDALEGGESVQRIVQLSAWRGSRHCYTARELAALELTEAVTVLTDGFVPDEVWERAAEQFDESELSGLLSTIVVINAWNRFAVSTRTAPGS